MSTLQIVYSMQKELLTTIGPDNPYVKPDQLYNTLEKITEVAGFPSAQPFFTKPDPQEIQQKLEASRNQPNPEIEKIKAQEGLEKLKIQGARDKEMAQMEADLKMEEARLQTKAVEAENALVLQREKMANDKEIALSKIEADIIMAREANAINVKGLVPDIMKGGLSG